MAVIGALICMFMVAGCATEQAEPETADVPKAVEEPAVESETDADFEVTEELYEQTFSEVEQVIYQLNEIISAGEFEAWKDYLTPEYIAAITDPEHLEQLNNSPLLQRNDIVVDDLQDYFEYVVVPSRANLRLDDLEFIDDNTVQAIMVVRDRRAILYLLRRINGDWLISV